MQIVSRIIKMDKNVPYLTVNFKTTTTTKKKTQKNALGELSFFFSHHSKVESFLMFICGSRVSRKWTLLPEPKTYKNYDEIPGGNQQMFIRGGSARGPTPYPFTYHFSRKRCPFRIPSIDKWYPFHIPCLELCIPFNYCKCAVF